MTRETILAAIGSCEEFRHKHPVISVSISLLMIAACIAGMYLVIKSPFLKITCFTGGCGQ
jgi:hypothetical protein